MKLDIVLKSQVLAFLTLATTFVTASASPMSTKMVAGDEAFKRVTKLTTEISWYTSLDYAKKIAQKENKPIFWIHMLGPLNGMT